MAVVIGRNFHRHFCPTLRKRAVRRTKISRARVVGCSLVAMLALHAAASSASADELSELRGDSELLQQRLDEINRVQAARASAASDAGAGAPNAVTGAGFPRSFLLPGTDTSVSVGGDVKAGFGYRSAPDGR
jgi:hypothetical protein